jgi:hypothetical protein
LKDSGDGTLCCPDGCGSYFILYDEG